MSRPTGVYKWRPEGLPAWFAQCPKATLYVIALQLAAQISGEYETALEDGRADERLLDEWKILHAAGVVPQKPPKEA